MPLIKHTSQEIRNLIRSNPIKIIRHQSHWHQGVLALKETNKAICPIEECLWCRDWVPTQGTARLISPAYTHQVEITQDAQGNAVRQVKRGSERMVCFDCYRRHYEVIRKAETIYPRREIPYAKPDELVTIAHPVANQQQSDANEQSESFNLS